MKEPLNSTKTLGLMPRSVSDLVAAQRHGRALGRTPTDQAMEQAAALLDFLGNAFPGFMATARIHVEPDGAVAIIGPRGNHLVTLAAEQDGQISVLSENVTDRTAEEYDLTSPGDVAAILERISH